MAMGLQLGIDQIAVEADLEPPAFMRDESQRFDLRFELFEQFGRQTGGAVGVVSDRTIDQLDFEQHTSCLLNESMQKNKKPHR